MRVLFHPCRAEHLRYMIVRPEQETERMALISGEYAPFIDRNMGMSAWAGSVCIGAAGLMPLFPHRAIAWALLSADVGRYKLAIVRKMRAVLALDPTPRVEMSVREDFVEGHRLAIAVGMTRETGVLRKYGANGEDEVLYVRLK